MALVRFRTVKRLCNATYGDDRVNKEGYNKASLKLN